MPSVSECGVLSEVSTVLESRTGCDSSFSFRVIGDHTRPKDVRRSRYGNASRSDISWRNKSVFVVLGNSVLNVFRFVGISISAKRALKASSTESLPIPVIATAYNVVRYHLIYVRG